MGHYRIFEGYRIRIKPIHAEGQFGVRQIASDEPCPMILLDIYDIPLDLTPEEYISSIVRQGVIE